MSWLEGHILLMIVYALLTGAFFALLWKSEARARIRLFAIVSLGLLAGGIAIAWAMFPFPR